MTATVTLTPSPGVTCQNCSIETAQVRAGTVGSQLDVCLKCVKANSGRLGFPHYDDAKSTYDEWTKQRV